VGRPLRCSGASVDCGAVSGCVRDARSHAHRRGGPAVGRVTGRLRDNLATAIGGSNRSVADVAAELGVSWPTAHKAPSTLWNRRVTRIETHMTNLEVFHAPWARCHGRRSGLV
jgi:hypothetical protein